MRYVNFKKTLKIFFAVVALVATFSSFSAECFAAGGGNGGSSLPVGYEIITVFSKKPGKLVTK